MNKEIIGYKLNKPEYKDAVNRITKLTLADDELYHSELNSPSYHKLKEAGVLDLWFKPVFTGAELKISKWYNYNSALVNYQGMQDGILTGYGWLHRKSTWSDICKLGFNPEEWTPATDYEVQQAFVEEAKKRGFKAGVKVKSQYSNIGFYILNKTNPFDVCINSNTVAFGGICIFSDGKWAEVEKVKLPTIQGYEGKHNKRAGSIDFGCATLPIEWFKAGFNRHISYMTLSSGVTIDRHQMDQIREYLKQYE